MKAIDDAVVREHEERERTYLGASVIGKPCERQMWYTFRWAYQPGGFSGRMLRLFRRGHLKESQAIEDLRRAGMQVEEGDPETGGQWGVSAIGGHLRGHMDGQVLGVPGAEKTKHLFENKTHNAKSFAELKKHKVGVAKPEHMTQMQIYMHLGGLTRSLYLSLNKDNEEYYAERVKYDEPRALRLMAKAERVITAHRPADKIADSSKKFPCTMCPAKGVCHDGEWAPRNCRTCLHSTPTLNGDGEWHCARHKTTLDEETQRSGCPHHTFIPELVPGELVDADVEAETVTYTLKDGQSWTDGPVSDQGTSS